MEGSGKFRAAALTDPGLRRDNNEDSVFLEPPHSDRALRSGLLAAVADGIGGSAYGEVASQLALQTLSADYYDEGEGDVEQRLDDAIYAANEALLADSRVNPQHAGMGTTIVAAAFRDNHVTVGHAGDSRAYMVRGDRCQRLTHDHSLVAEAVARGDLTAEQARDHPQRNIITKALGFSSDFQADIAAYPLHAGDAVVLCTDGLHGVVEDEEIASVIADRDPGEAVQELINLANQRGGPDNIGVVVVRRL